MTQDERKLKVFECFESIQGESTFAGRLCYFIRLAGCNLRCSYCDTQKALSFDSYTETLTPEELAEEQKITDEQKMAERLEQEESGPEMSV